MEKSTKSSGKACIKEYFNVEFDTLYKYSGHYISKYLMILSSKDMIKEEPALVTHKYATLLLKMY